MGTSTQSAKVWFTRCDWWKEHWKSQLYKQQRQCNKDLNVRVTAQDKEGCQGTDRRNDRNDKEKFFDEKSFWIKEEAHLLASFKNW